MKTSSLYGKSMEYTLSPDKFLPDVERETDEEKQETSEEDNEEDGLLKKITKITKIAGLTLFIVTSLSIAVITENISQ